MRLALLAVATFALAIALAPVPAAASHEPPGTQCMAVYSETVIGPLKIVRPDSCHAYYYLCDRPLAEAIFAPDPLDCGVTIE